VALGSAVFPTDGIALGAGVGVAEGEGIAAVAVALGKVADGGGT